MTGKRMTKGEIQQELGAFDPVGHAVLAFENDQAAGDARQALLDAGFDDLDILEYTSDELRPLLDEMVRLASGAAGFGYEINLMKRYQTLAQGQTGWLIVYSPDDDKTARVADAAKRHGAVSAVRYGRMMHEDLV